MFPAQILQRIPSQRRLRLSKAAKYLDICPATLRTMIRRGEIPASKERGGFFLLLEDLEKYVEER